MAAYFFASPVDVDIKLDDEEDRKKVEIKGDKEKLISCPVYYDGESISGQVCPLSALLPLPPSAHVHLPRRRALTAGSYR